MFAYQARENKEGIVDKALACKDGDSEVGEDKVVRDERDSLEQILHC